MNDINQFKWESLSPAQDSYAIIVLTKICEMIGGHQIMHEVKAWERNPEASQVTCRIVWISVDSYISTKQGSQWIE